MTWVYVISAGLMARERSPAPVQNASVKGFVGYSGHPPHRDDPTAVALRDVGPIPPGRYRIGPAEEHPRLGPLVMALTPERGTETFGRDDLYIHGDSEERPGEASDGCIVLSRPARSVIAESTDRELLVVA
jgi:hypothetical protein